MKEENIDMIEIREDLEEVELRATDDGKEVITGYAIVFNRESQDLGGFKEIILPSAVDGVRWSETIATFNHNADNILGRVPKTMTLTVDERGVKVEIVPPDTTVGRDVMELIRRRDVKGMSFTFRIKKNGDKWEQPKGDKGPYLRTISAFDIIPELGPVAMPAYPSTNVSVAKRALSMLMDEKERQESDQIERENQLQKIKLQNYHRAMRLKLRGRKG